MIFLLCVREIISKLLFMQEPTIVSEINIPVKGFAKYPVQNIFLGNFVDNPTSTLGSKSIGFPNQQIERCGLHEIFRSKHLSGKLNSQPNQYSKEDSIHNF